MRRGDLKKSILVFFVVFSLLTGCELPEGPLGDDLPGLDIDVIDVEIDESKEGGTAKTSAITNKEETQPAGMENGKTAPPDEETIVIGEEEEVIPEIPKETEPPKDKLVDVQTVTDRDMAVRPEKSIQIWTDMKNHSNISFQALASHPAVSLDGSYIAFSSNMNSATYQVYLRKADSAVGNYVQLTAGSADHLFPAVSPDNKRIAFASNKNGNFDIFVALIDNPVSQMQLTFHETDEIAPSWSPDGKQLVFCFKNNYNIWQLAIVDIATRVISFLGPGMFPKWSPNAADNWIAYQAQPTTYRKTFGIWIVKPDGSMLQQVVGDPEDKSVAFNPNWSPDGNWIVYSKSSQNITSKYYLQLTDSISADLYVVRKDGTHDTHLTETSLPEWAAAWSGRKEKDAVVNDRIFFVSYIESFQNIFSIKPPVIP